MRRSGLLSGFATPKMLDMVGSLVLWYVRCSPLQLCSAGVAATAWVVEVWRSAALLALRCACMRATRATTPEMLFERMAGPTQESVLEKLDRSLWNVCRSCTGVFYPAIFVFVSQLRCAVKLQSTPIVSQTGRSQTRAPPLQYYRTAVKR